MNKVDQIIKQNNPDHFDPVPDSRVHDVSLAQEMAEAEVPDRERMLAVNGLIKVLKTAKEMPYQGAESMDPLDYVEQEYAEADRVYAAAVNDYPIDSKEHREAKTRLDIAGRAVDLVKANKDKQGGLDGIIQSKQALVEFHEAAANSASDEVRHKHASAKTSSRPRPKSVSSISRSIGGVKPA